MEKNETKERLCSIQSPRPVIARIPRFLLYLAKFSMPHYLWQFAQNMNRAIELFQVTVIPLQKLLEWRHQIVVSSHGIQLSVVHLAGKPVIVAVETVPLCF